MIILLLAVVVFEAAMIYFVRYFYYSSIESVLMSEVKLSMDLFESYFSDSLGSVVLQDYDMFYRRTDAQVQLLNNKGVVVMDSIASSELGQNIHTEDVSEALKGRTVRSVHTVPYGDGRVMSVTAPLRNKTQQIGFIRLSASLKDADEVITSLIRRFVVFGLLVLLFAYVLILIFTRSIVRPIRRLTTAARRIAQGNYSIKVDTDRRDELGTLARSINEMTENIVKKDQLKNDFISSISHELRTPLTSIKGWAITLKEEDFGENELISDGLDIIEKESDRLSQMVEELLDFSRFVSGRISLSKEMVDICELIRSIETQFMIRARNEKINLVVNIYEMPVYLYVDKNRIKQVIINFLDNALKFTLPGGTVFLNLEDHFDHVIFEVIDTGIGIKGDELQLVTERFYKGNNARSNTGLGLSISEEIILLHGGELEITSRENEGTTMRVYLPKGVDDDETME